MEEVSWRITPMTILNDTAPLHSQYLRLGFSEVDIKVAGCVALRAGDSYLILASTECLARDFKESSVARLSGRTIAYVYVRSLEAAKAALSEEANILDEVVTDRNTIELLVQDNGQMMILAQQTRG